MTAYVPTQKGLVVLDSLHCEGPVDAAAALVRFGRTWRKTLESLRDHGLVRYFPTSETWRITPDGKAEIKRFWSNQLSILKE